MAVAKAIDSLSVLRPYHQRKVAITASTDSLMHYGVKGMKWGVRRTPEQLGHKKAIADDKNTGKINTTIISGHNSSPKTSTPNSVMDHVDQDGKVDKRTYYDSEGKKSRDIHTTDHGNPKKHPYGEHGEHAHDYEWNEDGTKSKVTSRDLNDDERKENQDIL